MGNLRGSASMQKKDGDTENRKEKTAPARTEAEVAALLAVLRDTGTKGTESDYVRSKAFSELCEQYQPLVDRMVRRFSLSPYTDKHELEEEARIALFCAATEYQENRHTTFGLYAGVCIRNRLISCVRRQKKTATERNANETYVSVSRGSGMDPGEQVASRDAFRENMVGFLCSLTDYERKVFDLYIRGSSYREIAEKLQVPEKSVDNAVYRIRVKLKTYIK